MNPAVEVRIADGVGHVRLAMPEKRNAIGDQMADDFEEAVSRLADEGVTLGILESSPPVFCAGNDLGGFGGGMKKVASLRFLECLVRSEVFWIAKVKGPALGAGAAIVAACPVVVADENSWFSLPERNIGVFPAGVLPYMEQAVGRAHAFDWARTGERITADEALRTGLISKVAPSGSVASAVEAEVVHAQESGAEFLEGARNAWQAHFTSAAFRERFESLMHSLEGVTPRARK